MLSLVLELRDLTAVTSLAAEQVLKDTKASVIVVHRRLLWGMWDLP